MKKKERSELILPKGSLVDPILYIFQKYLGPFGKMFSKIEDPRNPNRIVYSLDCVCFTGILMFFCQLGARWKINTLFRNSETFFDNYFALFGVDLCPHGDTVEYLFQKLSPVEIEETKTAIIKKLLRQKLLYPFRFLGKYFTIAVDGTQLFSSDKPLFEGCLSRKLSNGKIQYYAYVVEAKLICFNGFSFSIATEFVENKDPNASKQDCEHQATRRLLARLKKTFPRLPIVLLLDGLFADGVFLGLSKKHNWKHFIVLKDKDLSSVNEEFDSLSIITPAQHLHHQEVGLEQDFAWINDIEYTDTKNQKHTVNVLQCEETKDGKFTKFKYITNFNIDRNNVQRNIRQARLRAKIENEGFNVQKNDGYEMAHAYSKNQNSYKVYYLFLQIAHILAQLLLKSSLLGKIFHHIKSAINFARLSLEALRNTIIDAEKIKQSLIVRKIHIDSS